MTSDLERVRHYLETGELLPAASLLERVIRSSPKNAEALVLRARLAIAMQAADDAVEWLRRAAKAAPNRWDVHLDIGTAYVALDRIGEAIRRFEAAASLSPASVEPQLELGRVYLDCLRQPSQAETAFRRALELSPDHLDAQYHLAKALFQLGQADQAVAAFRHARQIAHAGGRSDVVALCLKAIAVMIPGSPAADNAEILAARREWAQTQEPPQQIDSPFAARDRSPDRPLVVGYVSSFFDRENWMKPVWALLNEHDRSSFQVRIFSFGPVPGGEQRGAGVDTAWRPHDTDRVFDVEGLTNDALAKVIIEEGVDVLVDLNGYSDMSRLGLFMLRPAPVIVGWFNMYATTALSCFDYLIGDRHVVREDEERHYIERIVRVPGSYLTFQVGYTVPPVAQPPCITSGQITFGSLSSRYKITPDVIRAWSEILHRCGGARLLLRNAALDTQTERERLWDDFEQHGIARSRLELLGRAPHFQFLETYAGIDIALDTFPYNGGTTTTEAIWQGVPVVAYAGPTWASRTSTTILREGGLNDWVADDLPGYIELAVRWGIDPQTPRRLTDLRHSMRKQLSGSPVCDTVSFARDMESLYRRMWQSWSQKELNVGWH